MSNNENKDWNKLSLHQLIAEAPFAVIKKRLDTDPNLMREIDVKNKEQKTPLQIAKERNDPQIYHFILSRLAMQEYDKRGMARPNAPSSTNVGTRNKPQTAAPSSTMLTSASRFGIMAAIRAFISKIIGYVLKAVAKAKELFKQPASMPKLETTTQNVQPPEQAKNVFKITTSATAAFKQLQAKNPKLCLLLLRHFAQRTNLLIDLWDKGQVTQDKNLCRNTIAVFKEFDKEWSKIMQAADNPDKFYNAIEEYLDKYDMAQPAADQTKSQTLTRSSMLFREIAPDVQYDDSEEIAAIRAQLKVDRSAP